MSRSGYPSPRAPWNLLGQRLLPPFLLLAAMPARAQDAGGFQSGWTVLGDWLWLVLAVLAVAFAILHWRSVAQARVPASQQIPLILDLDALPEVRPDLRRTVPDPPVRATAAPLNVPVASVASEAPAAPQRVPERTTETSGAAESETICLNWSAEVPLEILPGKLEIMEDGEPVRDIQFIRTMSGPLEFTIGRSHGPPDRHIRLDAPTVSRLHAQMRLDRDKGWLIANRSQTNPVRLNGREMECSGDYRALANGDVIQIGHFFLRFRN